jgi:activator of HSP90 ATPase
MGDRTTLAIPTDELTRRQAMVAVMGAFGGLVLGAREAGATTGDGISHSAESIHQEPVFAASPKRVYEVLTDANQFTRIVELSGALQTLHLPHTPVAIGPDAGSAFALFGGFITGRHIELVPNERIVQAWRAGDWSQGVFSIARFQLEGQGSHCKIVFDHTGFPKGEAQSLASGWKTHYWKPLAKLLA